MQKFYALLLLAFLFIGCKPIEEPPIPQEGYFYVLELGASTIEFHYSGGTYTLTPKGITFFNGQVIEEKKLSLSDLDIVLTGGDEGFLIRDGLTFSTNATTKNNVAYYNFTWKERGISEQLCVAQRKKTN